MKTPNQRHVRCLVLGLALPPDIMSLDAETAGGALRSRAAGASASPPFHAQNFAPGDTGGFFVPRGIDGKHMALFLILVLLLLIGIGIFVRRAVFK